MHPVQIEDVLQHCKVRLLQETNQVKYVLDVLVFPKVIGQSDVISEMLGLFNCLTNLVIVVDVTQLRVDSFDHQRNLVEVVLLHHKRKALTKVSATPSQPGL